MLSYKEKRAKGETPSEQTTFGQFTREKRAITLMIVFCSLGDKGGALSSTCRPLTQYTRSIGRAPILQVLLRFPPSCPLIYHAQ